MPASGDGNHLQSKRTYIEKAWHDEWSSWRWLIVAGVVALWLEIVCLLLLEAYFSKFPLPCASLSTGTRPVPNSSPPDGRTCSLHLLNRIRGPGCACNFHGQLDTHSNPDAEPRNTETEPMNPQNTTNNPRNAEFHTDYTHRNTRNVLRQKQKS